MVVGMELVRCLNSACILKVAPKGFNNSVDYERS